MDKGSLVIIMAGSGKTGFDFVGICEDWNSEFVTLKNPLVMDYSEQRTLSTLTPMHIPFGSVDVFAGSKVIVPKDTIGYIVELPGTADDWIHREYEKFWKEDDKTE